MSRNGSGVYSPPGSSFPAVANTLIEASKFNNTINDIGTALTESIARDGQTTITANIPMATFKFTGLGAGSAATDSARLGQVQDGSTQWCGTAGGTADALTLTPSPAITAYAAGQRFVFKSGASANTGAATINVSSVGAITLQKNGAALVAGDVAISQWYEVILSSATVAQLQSISSASGTVSPVFTGTPTAPTAAEDTNTTQLATTAFVLGQAASQAQMEAASSTTQFATAGNTNWHPGVAKAWACISIAAGTPALDTSHNITSIADTATGVITIAIATDFSSANYCIALGIRIATANEENIYASTQAAGEIVLHTRAAGGGLTDITGGAYASCFGDQA